jgi:hypothetical protein
MNRNNVAPNGVRNHTSLARKRIGSAIAASALLLAAATHMTGCAQDAQAPAGESSIVESRVLTNTVEVDGRQGVAAENGWRWVSGSTTLSKYDGDWNLVATNDSPFDEGYDLKVNHIGDIDVYKNEVYCGVELFEDGIA